MNSKERREETRRLRSGSKSATVDGASLSSDVRCGVAQQIVKLHRNPDRLFFYTVLLTMFVVGVFAQGVEGYKWTQAHKPSAQFFVGIIFICLGPSLMASALNARASEAAGTVWKKTWPATFAGGIIVPLLGVAMLWKLFMK